MTPARMAEIHAAAFQTQRPWSETEFVDLLASDLVFQTAPSTACFALGRAVAGEAELLTIATDPALQGLGHGKRCLNAFLDECRAQNVSDVFLDVAKENTQAIGLYRVFSFEVSGQRKGYYHHPDGTFGDALLMTLKLA